MKNKPITLPPIHPNIGLQLLYQRKIEKIVDEMNKSVLYWLRTEYNANKPEMAQDASPAVFLTQVLRRLARRWEDRFEVYAKKLAKYFATEAKDRVDGTLKSILKKSGFAVEFKMTAAANDVMQATIQQNVGLIKSIASRHFEEIEGLVLRSVATGRDLKSLTDELEKRFKVTRKRAAFIARDQNNKATAVITRVRQEGLGVTEAIWKHSHAGKAPRPEHQKWHNQKYDVSKGMWSEVDQEYVWPGTAINCRCGSRSIIPGLNRE